MPVLRRQPTTERAALLRELPAAAVDALLAVAGPDSDSPQAVVELRLLGGALNRPGSHPSAFCHRDAAFSLLSIGIAAPQALPAVLANADAIVTAIAPWTHPGTLPNFGGAATAASVGGHYDGQVLHRLATLAASYDPDAVLARSHPVREAAGTSRAAAPVAGR